MISMAARALALLIQLYEVRRRGIGERDKSIRLAQAKQGVGAWLCVVWFGVGEGERTKCGGKARTATAGFRKRFDGRTRPSKAAGQSRATLLVSRPGASRSDAPARCAGAPDATNKGPAATWTAGSARLRGFVVDGPQQIDICTGYRFSR
jgi:hypothetical protein